MLTTRIRNHFRFALKQESLLARENMPPNQIEKLGNILSWLAYSLPKIIRDFFCDPRYLTILFTFFFMSLTALLFYPSHTLSFLLDCLIWVILHIHLGYLRFTLWCLSECTILGLGLRAFGRFSNPQLMKFYGFT